jgi:hypothetical protein
MWHGVPTKFQVSPNLLNELEHLGALDHVSYVYLPMTWSRKPRSGRCKCTNKGYAFIHFNEQAAADEFKELVGEFANEKPCLTLADCQGLSANLRQLLSARKRSIEYASVYIRDKSDRLEEVSVADLRALTRFKNRTTKEAHDPELVFSSPTSRVA